MHHQMRGYHQADVCHDRCCECGNYRSYKSKEKHGGTYKMHSEGQTKKPCHVHGPEAKHSYDKCHQNPKNCANKNNNNKFVASQKRKHEVHY